MVSTENLLQSCDFNINKDFWKWTQLFEILVSSLLLGVESTDFTGLQSKNNSAHAATWSCNTIACNVRKFHYFTLSKILVFVLYEDHSLCQVDFWCGKKLRLFGVSIPVKSGSTTLNIRWVRRISVNFKNSAAFILEIQALYWSHSSADEMLTIRPLIY